MKTFTNAQIVEAARAAVAEKGEEYVYPESLGAGGSGECRYANPDGTPSCIVGNIINRLSPEDFAKIAEREEMDGSFGPGMLDWYSDVALSEEQVYALRSAQADQDGGEPWGYALTKIEALEDSGDEPR